VKDPLAQFTLLDELGKAGRLALLPYLAERSWDEGRTLFRAGEESQELLFVLDGKLRVELHGSEVCTLGPGELIGGLSLLMVGRRRCGIVATSAVRAFALERATYVRLRGDDPALALAVQEAVLTNFARALGAAGVPELLADPAPTVDGSGDDD
jgi:CRP-like cAMP-binding protein